LKINQKISASFAWFCAIVALGSSAICWGDESGLKTNVAVDIVGNAASRNTEKIPTQFRVRGAELNLYAPVDHTFDGLLGLAAHQEDGTAHFEIHEAVLSSSKLIPNSRLRFGQFFLGIGRLNAIHRHDWPFITAPKVQQEFFGSEGISDTGLEYSIAVPHWAAMDLSLGVSNGWTFGHSHTAGQKPKRPSHYARLASFFALPADGGLQVAGSFLGRTDAEGMRMMLVGTDAVVKWREGRIIPFLLQSELWWRELKPSTGQGSKSLGFYIYPQTHLGALLDFGLLYDHYRPLNLKDALGEPIVRVEHNFAPTITWRNSEYSSIRANYTWKAATEEEKSFKVTNSYFEIQSVFILGAHPAHEF
jgi:hypothetical protein